MSERLTPRTAETVTTTTRLVTCDGPAFGKHPRIYLTMNTANPGEPERVVCPYCSRVFTYDAGQTQNP